MTLFTATEFCEFVDPTSPFPKSPLAPPTMFSGIELDVELLPELELPSVNSFFDSEFCVADFGFENLQSGHLADQCFAADPPSRHIDRRSGPKQ